MSFKEMINNAFGVHSPSKAFYFTSTEDVKVKKIDDKKESEEWIWVDGYKGTDKDMCCQGYQYGLGKVHTMNCPDEEIRECYNGFHLCKNLSDVFRYYSIGDGNRYFKVQALVRKADYDIYGKYTGWGYRCDKLVAKSIIFTEEVDQNMLIEYLEVKDDMFKILPLEYKKEALKTSIGAARLHYRESLLEDLGYSEPLTKYLITYGTDEQVEKAIAFGSHEGLSMDVKVMMIFLDK